MNRHLIGRKYVASRWLIIRRIAAGLVKGVDYQLAVDKNRLLALFVVEQDPAAEAALRLLPRLRHHRVGPGADHPHRSALLRLVLVAKRPGIIQAEHLRRLPSPHRACAGSERENQRETDRFHGSG